MTCSVVFIVNIKKIKSLGGMPEETTDGGIEIENNEAYGIVNRGGEGRGGGDRGGERGGGGDRGGERGGGGVELVSHDTASKIMVSKENTNREYELFNFIPLYC